MVWEQIYLFKNDVYFQLPVVKQQGEEHMKEQPEAQQVNQVNLIQRETRWQIWTS